MTKQELTEYCKDMLRRHSRELKDTSVFLPYYQVVLAKVMMMEWFIRELEDLKND